MRTSSRFLVVAASLIVVPTVASAQRIALPSGGQTVYLENVNVDGSRIITKAQVLRFQQTVSTPVEAATGMATGRRVYEPITIVRRPDAQSPLFFKALCNNEPVTLQLTVYSGVTRQFTFELAAARVVFYEQKTEGAGVIEVLKIMFSDITIREDTSGAEHHDNFAGPA